MYLHKVTFYTEEIVEHFHVIKYQKIEHVGGQKKIHFLSPGK